MKKILVGLIVFLVLITGAYASYRFLIIPKDDKDGGEPAPKPIPVVVKKLKIVNPDSKTRPYAVMINNINVARPNHAGLQDALIVYEMIVEGDITRMMAIFKDQTTARIGSVRSARHYYLDYAMENDAIYVHFGGSPQAARDIANFRIQDIDGMADGGFWRDTTLGVASEHTAFTSITKLDAAVLRLRYRTETTAALLLDYSIEEINLDQMEGSIVANTVRIPYSSYMTPSYSYDVINKVYNRFANGLTHKDGITNLQYTAKNIITYRVTNTRLDSYGRQTLYNVGSGDGYYITNGYAVPIKWTKADRSSQTVYTYLSGKEITVNDGNTYIQIQPSSQALSIN